MNGITKTTIGLHNQVLADITTQTCTLHVYVLYNTLTMCLRLC